jgi:hypothetical protein
LGSESLPKPAGHVFDGRILQAWDLIEIGMIEHLRERAHCSADGGMIEEPAGFRIDGALDGNLHLKTVPVHLAALVALRSEGQCLGGFECEIFGQADLHGGKWIGVRAGRTLLSRAASSQPAIAI